MRHLNKGRQLNRSASHRKALMENLAQELFQHKRIRTTITKAKELRSVAEKLVTIAKKNHLAARRHVLRFINRKEVVKSLFEEIAPSFADRNGGYTRIIKLNQRVGDAAQLAIIELVGFEGVVHAAAEAKASKKASTEDKGKTAAKPKPKKKPAKEGAAETKGAKPKKTAARKSAKAESSKAAKTSRTRKTGEK